MSERMTMEMQTAINTVREDLEGTHSLNVARALGRLEGISLMLKVILEGYREAREAREKSDGE